MKRVCLFTSIYGKAETNGVHLFRSQKKLLNEVKKSGHTLYIESVLFIDQIS